MKKMILATLTLFSLLSAAQALPAEVTSFHCFNSNGETLQLHIEGDIALEAGSGPECPEFSRVPCDYEKPKFKFPAQLSLSHIESSFQCYHLL